MPRRSASPGYETAAIVSSFVLDRRFGLAAGFETYDDGRKRFLYRRFLEIKTEAEFSRERARAREALSAPGPRGGRR